MARAIAFETRGNKIDEQNLTLNLTTGSEVEKRAYIRTIPGGGTDSTISMHVQGVPNNPQAARLALTTILQRQGRVLDALIDIYSTLRQHLKPEDQALLNQLSATRSQLSVLASKDRPAHISADEYRRQLTTLDEQAQELEATLSRHSEEFRAQTQPATIEAVQPLIPADAALVELEEYYPGNPKTNKWGTPRYVAYILHSTGDPQWVDLGAAQAINQAVANFRRTVQDSSQSPAQVKQVARSLDALLMQPIRQRLGNSHHLLLAPDSQLSLVPFAALADQHNQYLVENYLITYLSSGRDLLKLQIHAQSQLPPVLVANPDFDHPGNKVVVQSPTRIRGTGNERALELADVRFDSLIGLEQEAKAIASLLPKVKLLTGADATKSALKQLHGPNILHIATHGFFLTDEPRPKPEPVRGLSALGERGFPRAIATLQNPLLRSGLALAGANLRKDGNDDGLLTALEAADLDLRGTKLLVLSACDTGLGDVVNGEGVYGLRRAFAIAGTETQVMSLWSAYDQTTKDMMIGYYQRLMNNVGRGEALRQVQLEMLKSKEYQNPYYWAAFIASGDWSSLK